jgi:hypothetical protein
MTQADSVHSTPRINTSATRRRFLSNAAGVVAGGAVLALATIPPTSAAIAPAALARRPKVDRKLMHASCDLTVMDLALTGLYSKYGDDADSREDYQAIEQQRDENIEILSTVRAESWAGIWAKAAALRSERTIEDYESALAIAASLADDIMQGEPEGLAVKS